MEVTKFKTILNPPKLSEKFLSMYRRKGDPFTSLLARSTYLTKYCRNQETWTDTIQRVVEGSAALEPTCSKQEMELLFHLFWTCQALPPGRGLWVGGVEGIPADARYNCWGTTLYSIDDWCWTANQLMLGGGVGVWFGSLDALPIVRAGTARFAIWCAPEHPDCGEVEPEGPSILNGSTPKYVVEDSREGWVTALRTVLTHAFANKDLVVDVSLVRKRGEPIKTFGGIACGPGPLATLIRASWEIVRGAAGRKLTSVEALDITNHIGLCIKSGNVRRSALLVLGEHNDGHFRNAKKDWEAVKAYRHTSNNSITFRDSAEMSAFDWNRLAEDNAEFGEPGIVNLALARKTDPKAMGVNPCFSGDTLVAVADGRNAVKISQLSHEGRDVPVYAVDRATGKVQIKLGRNPRITGYEKRLIRVWLDDGGYLDTTLDHKFLLFDGSKVQAKDLRPGMSLPRFTKELSKVKAKGSDYYRIYCDTRDPSKSKIFEHRLIAKFHSPDEWVGVYDSCKKNGFALTGGLVVHHKDFNPLNNSPINLQIMSFKDHALLHSGHGKSGEENGRWCGVSNEALKQHGLELTQRLGHRFSIEEWVCYAKELSLPQGFSKYRRQGCGNIIDFAKWCATELKIEHSEEDPRTVVTLNTMLGQGYSGRIADGRVLLGKTCEGCGTPFEIEHLLREQAFCSRTCSTNYVNTDSQIKTMRVGGIHAAYSKRQVGVKESQARICSELKVKLGRDPNREEWSLACKAEGVASRIGPALKFGFQGFSEVLEAGNRYNHKVVRIEKLPGSHTVYNLTVDDFHTVAIVTSTSIKEGHLAYSGVYVAQCGEVILHDRESCNLAEVFPANFSVTTAPSTAFKLVTRYCLRQRLSPLSDPKSDQIRLKNMRLGVGLGGVCDFDWKPSTLAHWFLDCREEANKYADELGVNRPIAVTTTKPSGTISLLANSSPGIHSPFAPYYLRRVRIAKNDPMAGAMIDANVPHEDCVYDKTGYTWVFSFPTKARHTRSTVQTQTLREQFERQTTIQENWSDNAVSATLTFDKHEVEELATLLKEFVPRLKSTSCLPKAHGYAQPPYESCSEEKYRELSDRIDNSHHLTNGGNVEIDECSSGACPVK